VAKNNWKAEHYGEIKTKEGKRYRVGLKYEWKQHHFDAPSGADHIVPEFAAFELLVGPFLEEGADGKTPSNDALRQAAINRAMEMISNMLT